MRDLFEKLQIIREKYAETPAFDEETPQGRIIITWDDLILEGFSCRESLMKVHNLLDAWEVPNVEKRADGWDRILTAAERLQVFKEINHV